MSPVNTTIAELRLVVDQATARCVAMQAQIGAGIKPTPDAFSDHRTEIVGELIDCLDRVDPGLGGKLLHALYPLGVDEDPPESGRAH